MLEVAVPLAEALLAGGLDTIEITLRTDFALDGIRAIRAEFPQAYVGAGTVHTTEDAKWAIDAGAQFIVSPGTAVDVMQLCQEEGLPMLPGACTPTEVNTAVQAGAEAVKFFPAEAMGGSDFLQALAGPFRTVSFVPTGGIHAGNLAAYLRLPNVIACGGSWMVAPALVANQDFVRIEQLTREALRTAAEVKHS